MTRYPLRRSSKQPKEYHDSTQHSCTEVNLFPKKRAQLSNPQYKQHALKVAIVSPWPTAIEEDPPSGVANYLAAILLSDSIPCDVHVIAQRGHREDLTTKQVTIHSSWYPGIRASLDVFRSLRKVRPDVVHLHHEFRLFGGLLATGAVFVAVIMASFSARIITTIHGVVSKERLQNDLVGINNHWVLTILVDHLLAVNYKLIELASDQIVVLHDTLKDILKKDYGISALVIPLAIRENHEGPQCIKIRREENTVMVFGFLTAYKRPELVLDLAEQNLLPGTRYVVSVGLNPRIKDRKYQLRYTTLRKRAEALSDRVTWHNYLPDEELRTLLSRMSILVLPYTELVGATAAGAQGLESGIAICHSVALMPIFGDGPTMFEMTTTSLRSAILAANLDQRQHQSPALSWTEVLQQTVDLWNETRIC